MGTCTPLQPATYPTGRIALIMILPINGRSQYRGELDDSGRGSTHGVALHASDAARRIA
jgi:hypothetical protein